MAQKILSISRRAGDTNVGQTLIRMARLAAAAHLHDNVAHSNQERLVATAQAPTADAPKQRSHAEVDR